MRGGGEMFDAFDVRGPEDLSRIHWSGNDRLQVARATRRFDQQLVERWLTIDAVGAHVTDVPLRFAHFGKIDLRIDGAVQSARFGRAEFALDSGKHRTDRKSTRLNSSHV